MEFQNPATTRNGESGQTSGEYIAVTSIAILVAITVGWFVFFSSLSDALATMGEGLLSFITGAFP